MKHHVELKNIKREAVELGWDENITPDLNMGMALIVLAIVQVAEALDALRESR